MYVNVSVIQPEGDGAVGGDKEKDEVRSKSVKVLKIIRFQASCISATHKGSLVLYNLLICLQANKEEDDKMRTTAANVAARAAVGGDDMLSKWQLMAEQARQKREGGMDGASGSQGGKDVSRRSLSTSGRNSKDNQETENRGPGAPFAGKWDIKLIISHSILDSLS